MKSCVWKEGDAFCKCKEGGVRTRLAVSRENNQARVAEKYCTLFYKQLQHEGLFSPPSWSSGCKKDKNTQYPAANTPSHPVYERWWVGNSAELGSRWSQVQTLDSHFPAKWPWGEWLSWCLQSVVPEPGSSIIRGLVPSQGTTSDLLHPSLGGWGQDRVF